MFDTVITLKGFRMIGILILSLFVSACSNPSTIKIPEDKLIAEQRLDISAIKMLPKNDFFVQVGDTLRIVRDADRSEITNEGTLFRVNPDGTFNYPYAGLIKCAGKTIEEIQTELQGKLEKTYKEPQVTINIVEAAGNKYFVGGAVAKPSAYGIVTPTTLEQAIFQAGGVLTTADSENVALLRLDANSHYQVYFFDYGSMLTAGNDSEEIVILQRGDMIYVPKSGIGTAIDNVDMYLNKLIPFTKGFGVNYELNRP